MSELKCCPFCGGKAVVQTYGSEGGRRGVGYRVMCRKCYVITARKSDEGDAVRAWNTRKEVVRA